jgi:HEAT repeat protein
MHRLSVIGPVAGLLVTLAPSVSDATPLTSGQVNVSDDGQVTHGAVVLGRIPLPPPPRALRTATVEVDGHRLLQVKVTGRGGRAAELLSTLPPAPRSIFSGATGPQDVDGEWSRHLRVDRRGALLFQRREGALRCDGAPVTLFPRLYDFREQRFRPVSILARPEGIPEIIADRSAPGTPHGDPLNTFGLTFASTTLGDEERAANLGPPREAEDGRPETAWKEGLGGSGQGEFLTAQAQPSPYRLQALRIIPGDAASARSFRQANRIKSALLILSPGRAYRILFSRDPLVDRGRFTDPYWAVLPEPAATTCATFVIEEVYSGAAGGPTGTGNGGQTAIAELRFFTELDFQGGAEQLLRDLDGADLPRGAAAVTALSRLGLLGVELAGRRISAASPQGLKRRALALARIALPEVAPPLASLVPRLDRETRTTALEALVKLGSPAVPSLVPLLRGTLRAAGEVRADVARCVGAMGGPVARQALLEQAGAGDPSLRAAVVVGLGQLSGPADLDPVIDEALRARDPKRQADLVHALRRIGRSQRQSTAQRLAVLWTRVADFEVRYRLVSTLGRLDAEGQLAVLRRAAESEDPVLRWTALEQIRAVPGAAASEILRRATTDKDPQVRATAALALGRPPADPTIGLALARLLDNERWTMVALAAAEALSTHCGPPALAALGRALTRGPEPVDERALLSVARCNPTSLASDLLGVAREANRRTPLRRRALGLLSPAMIRSQATTLARLFDASRDAAPRSEDAAAMAVATARVLAASSSREAAETLADALALDPHESIRLAAALALGRICSPTSAQTLVRAASGDSSAAVRRAAHDARKRCQF